MDYTVVTARQTGNNRAIAAVTQITCTNRANLYVANLQFKCNSYKKRHP